MVVQETVAERLPATMTMGRYGPDEFLVIATGDAAADLEARVEAAREALRGVGVQFEESERLPITVSTGVCRFPEDGPSVTELLASAVAVLQDAKSGGGDRVVVARADLLEAGTITSFDVFQGLVIAIDSKDRYTKRHSEDVARYGVFLGRLLGLDDEQLEAIQVAGLLHDVGKIGVPDAVLRKPGRLTAEEYEAVKQHVALGDLIVRDLPDIEAVRAGIRHHHERWDGRGYLHALAADDIPLIARVLAVGDAFSAMTTTRPYRKALDVREALTRLGDAAGTQLDEQLVGTFIRGHRARPGCAAAGAGGGSRRAVDARPPGRVSARSTRLHARRRAGAIAVALGLLLGSAGGVLAGRAWTIDASPSSLDENSHGHGHRRRAQHRWRRWAATRSAAS